MWINTKGICSRASALWLVTFTAAAALKHTCDECLCVCVCVSRSEVRDRSECQRPRSASPAFKLSLIERLVEVFHIQNRHSPLPRKKDVSFQSGRERGEGFYGITPLNGSGSTIYHRANFHTALTVRQYASEKKCNSKYEWEIYSILFYWYLVVITGQIHDWLLFMPWWGFSDTLRSADVAID